MINRSLLKRVCPEIAIDKETDNYILAAFSTGYSKECSDNILPTLENMLSIGMTFHGLDGYRRMIFKKVVG